MQEAGSSPRVRGTRGHIVDRQCFWRFIPACAGNAAPGRTEYLLLTVHPRVCGERAVDFGQRGPIGGSSPRVRGTLSRSSRISTPSRFIPACAGNASSAARSARGAAVHPRVCGERTGAVKPNCFIDGSSPRVRGTRADTRPRYRLPRFIPACAGNALDRSPCSRHATVHPRVCGERAILAAQIADHVGSSPRVRGTRVNRIVKVNPVRFIPACAGNAGPRWRQSRCLAVHPRVCGERIKFEMESTGCTGSSPRVRGTRRQTDSGNATRRFIPACAGNAVEHTHRAAPMPVHPRVCGERSVALLPRL